MKPISISVLAALACLLTAAHAADEAGIIKSRQGTVSVERQGARSNAELGAKVYATDIVRTGADGSAGITLRDNTLLSAGPNSVLALEQFSFDSTTYQGKLNATLRKGSLAVVSGKLAKTSPESVQFRTPATILGVRGTEFVIEVDGAPGDKDAP